MFGQLLEKLGHFLFDHLVRYNHLQEGPALSGGFRTNQWHCFIRI